MRLLANLQAADQNLGTALLQAVLGKEEAKLAGAGDASRVLAVLENPSGWMSVAERNGVLIDTLGSAVRDLRGKLGPDMAKWKWGDLHRAEFRHPLRDVVDVATRNKLDVGDWSLSGASHTPMAASYQAGDYRLSAGASFRIIVDVGNWDDSRVINAPGQSGDPASPHYRDLVPLWLEGGYVPLVYSRAAVDRETVLRLRLEPGAMP